MKTVVLDDDPTGTQSASGVRVLLRWDAATIRQALTVADSVYLQTNSRAIPTDEAVALASGIKDQVAQAAHQLGQDIQIVLRGDSTLRGHVFTETDVFTDADSPILFLPAFPAGGRTTRDGVHYVNIAGFDHPAADTEYSDDPVFPFRHSNLIDYVREIGDRDAISVPLNEIRSSGGEAVAQALREATGGTVVAPDAVTDGDIDLVFAGLESALADGRRVVVRCAAPLAARCAGAVSHGLLPTPLQRPKGPILIACGSHTAGATAQLEALTVSTGMDPILLDTDAAFDDPKAAGLAIVDNARKQLQSNGLAVIGTARTRRKQDNTLAHGERVMTALTAAVHALADDAAVVVAKGGITSAQVASVGLNVTTAHVRGQILPGISVWDITTRRGATAYVVVPGNVGDPGTIRDVVRLLQPDPPIN